MSTVRTHAKADPVVTYDLMREAASHVIAQYAGRAVDGWLAEADIAAVRGIRAQVEAIDPQDIEAQRQLTEELRARLG